MCAPCGERKKNFVSNKFAVYYYTKSQMVHGNRKQNHFHLDMFSARIGMDVSNWGEEEGGIEERRVWFNPHRVTRSARSREFVCSKRLNDIEDRRPFVLPTPNLFRSSEKHLSLVEPSSIHSATSQRITNDSCGDRVFCSFIRCGNATAPGARRDMLAFPFFSFYLIFNTAQKTNKIICNFTNEILSHCCRTLFDDGGVRLRLLPFFFVCIGVSWNNNVGERPCKIKLCTRWKLD